MDKQRQKGLAMHNNISHLNEARAEKLLQDYVRIRHNMAGEERITALIEWAANVDRRYAAVNDTNIRHGQVNN